MEAVCPSKRSENIPQGFPSQKIILFKVTAEETSNISMRVDRKIAVVLLTVA
jgi:hypothetical protein